MLRWRCVVNREGRIANYELLKSERAAHRRRAARFGTPTEMVLDAVRQSRFAPAQTPVGRTVAVNMVWLIVMTTVQTPDPHAASGVAPVVARHAAPPPVDPIEEPPLKRSDRLLDVNDGLRPAPVPELLPAHSTRC